MPQPRRSALTSAATARERIAIIAVTAHAFSGERERIMQADMDDYLAKPVQLQAPHARLTRWLVDDR